MKPDSKYEVRLKRTRKLEAMPASYSSSAEKLTEDFQDRATSWLELGIAHTNLARYKLARQAFRKSIRLCKPTSQHFPLNWIGHSYQQQGNLKLAESWFRKSIDSSPDNPDSWAFLGSNLAKQGKIKEAISAWNQMVRLGTGATEEGYLNLGYLLRAEYKYRKALEFANKALLIDSKYKEARALKKDLENVLKNDA